MMDSKLGQISPAGKPFSANYNMSNPVFNEKGLPFISHAWFNDQDIGIDGWRFERCRFDNCRLHVSSLIFVFDHCYISDDTRIHYQGETIKLIQLFNHRNQYYRENYPAFAAIKNHDGTISIG